LWCSHISHIGTRDGVCQRLAFLSSGHLKVLNGEAAKLKRYVEKNSYSSLRSPDASGRIAIFEACKAGDNDCVRILANADKSNSLQNTLGWLRFLVVVHASLPPPLVARRDSATAPLPPSTLDLRTSTSACRGCGQDQRLVCDGSPDNHTCTSVLSGTLPFGTPSYFRSVATARGNIGSFARERHNVSSR
jgi:hypothetical protein